MLRVLWTRKAIGHAQARLEQEFRDASTGPRQLDLLGKPMDVCWVQSWDVWVAFHDEEPDRYRNVFGLGNPFAQPMRPIVEVNLPRAGVRRNIGGVVAGDAAHGLHLMHRGHVHGGKQKLMRWFQNQLVATLDRDEVHELVLVAAFDQPGFLGQVAAFVRAAEQFKAGAEAPAERSWITDQRTREAIEQAYRAQTGREGCAAARAEEVAEAMGRALLQSKVALLPLHLPQLYDVVEHVEYAWKDGQLVFTPLAP